MSEAKNNSGICANLNLKCQKEPSVDGSFLLLSLCISSTLYSVICGIIWLIHNTTK